MTKHMFILHQPRLQIAIFLQPLFQKLFSVISQEFRANFDQKPNQLSISIIDLKIIQHSTFSPSSYSYQQHHCSFRPFFSYTTTARWIFFRSLKSIYLHAPKFPNLSKILIHLPRLFIAFQQRDNHYLFVRSWPHNKPIELMKKESFLTVRSMKQQFLPTKPLQSFQRR